VNTLFGTLGGTLKLIKMPEIQAVLDVTLNELSSEHQLLLKEVVEQFQQKCLLSFSKNRSGVPFLRTDMRRVLMPGETDATTAAEKQEAFAMIRQAMEEIMTRHNTAFLNSFRQMMVGVFGPSADKHFERAQGPNGNEMANETGEASAIADGQPLRQDASAQPLQQSMSVQPTQHVGSQPIQQNPHQAIPNPRTYGEMAFGTTGVPPVSTYRIAPTSNRLRRNMYGNGYSEFMDYSAIDAFPNPGYGGATGMPAGRPGNQDANVDLLVQRMTDVLQNQFGLKPKNQGHVYTSPFPEWYHRVALPNRVKVPT
jgi:hypothetical protein